MEEVTARTTLKFLCSNAPRLSAQGKEYAAASRLLGKVRSVPLQEEDGNLTP
jgi:hypothetical protein